jgi:hypothetical protein
MTCMGPYLVWNITPPLWRFIVTGCLCLLSKAFSILLIHWLIQVYRVPVLQSNVNVVSILSCPRRLLLSLFIKLDYALKYGVAWFIIKELNKSFISWILSRIVLWLVVRILPIIIKKFSSVDLILNCQSAMKLPLVETYSSSICYHQHSLNCQVVQAWIL